MAGIEQRTQAIEERREGEVFQPFRDYTKFPLPKTLDQFSSEIIFTHKFTFKGVPLSLTLSTETEPQKFKDKETPLGRVKLIYSFENDQMKADEFPLTVGLDVEFPSVEKYREVQKYALKLDLAEESYYFRLGGTDKETAMERLIPLAGTRENRESFDYAPKNKDGQAKTVLLPFNPYLLRDINVRIVEKDLPRE